MYATPFDIADNAYGGKTCDNGAQQLVLMDSDGKAFRRRAVISNGQTVEWIVAELDNVRVYFDGVRTFVTRQDIYPT